MVLVILVTLLVAGATVYNSHRYLLKYGSSEFTDGTNRGDYAPTPIGWKLGKYAFTAAIATAILIFAGVKLQTNRSVYLYGFCLLWMTSIVISSGLIHHCIVHCSADEVRPDFLHLEELEICFFGFLFLPFAFIDTGKFIGFDDMPQKMIHLVSCLLALSNVFVIANFYLRGIAPFHYFDGYSIVRFGGLWDDPNGFAVVSAFLAFCHLHSKRYFWTAIMVANVAVTFSLTGYLLLVVGAVYYVIRRADSLIFFVVFGLLSLGALFAFQEQVVDFLESKRESLLAHASTNFELSLVPLAKPLIFHESWLLSFVVNYPPVSYIVVTGLIVMFFWIFVRGQGSIQECSYILFFVASACLPVLYMFPLNVLFLSLLPLYLRKVRF